MKFIKDMLICALGGMTQEDHEYAMEQQRKAMRNKVRRSEQVVHDYPGPLSDMGGASWISSELCRFIDGGCK